MQAYLLILEIAHVEVGESYPKLPLHCTLVHWFQTDTDLQELIGRIAEVVQAFHAQELSIGEEATFTGHTKQGPIPVTVNKVVRTPSLEHLHMRICASLDSLGVEYAAPQYVKKGFNPHVTHQSGAKLTVGASHLAKSVCLISAEGPEYGNQRHIVAKFELVD